MNSDFADWKKNPMYLVRMPDEEFSALCNGMEAYSDYAAALLSAAVVRIKDLRREIATLKAKK